MKKFTLFWAITLAFLISFTTTQTIFALEPEIQLFSANTPAEAEDTEPIELTITNNTGSTLDITRIDVQRLGNTEWSAELEGWEPIIVPGWEKTTLTEDPDTLYLGEVSDGQTKLIAEIGLGSPASWRGWYGGGDIVLEVWLFVDGEEYADSFIVYHEVTPAPCDPTEAHGGYSDVEFIQDNKDGSATIVAVLRNCYGEPVTGLKIGAFDVYQLVNEKSTDSRGRFVSATETEPGVYTLIWRYIVGTHLIILTVNETEVAINLPVAISTEAMPRTFKSITSNLGEILNVENTEKELTFTMAGFGSISFAPGLNLIDAMEELSKLADLLVITYDKDSNVMRASVDTKALTFLAGHNATITFFDVSKKLGIEGLTTTNFKQYLDIAVYDDGKAVGKISDYFDWDEVTYNSETDVLTLPVNHFTEYVLGESSELPETGSAIVGIVSLGLASLASYAILKKKKILS